MPLLATLTLACLSSVPQGPATQQAGAILTPAEQKTLQTKLTNYIEAKTAYDSEGGNDRTREKAQKDYLKAKAAFFGDWDQKCEKKGNLLKSMPDLRAIFGNCLPYEKRPAVSFRKVEAKDDIPAYHVSVPKSYKAETPTRALLVVPGLDEKSEWLDPKRWFEATWDKAAAVNDTILTVPIIAKDVELDPVADYSRTTGEAEEARRLGELMLGFGEVQRQYNVDRSRLFLDCGKGACAFALRVAAHFPDRFAGLILRHPTAVDEIRLGSLGGVRVLLVSSPATADVCKAVQERCGTIDAAMCTIVEATDEYPFKAAAPAIEKWMAGVQRDVNPTKVVLEPNDDRFRRGYWVQIATMDSVPTAPADQKPRVEATADRAQNRITIKAIGVESLHLRLNDSLVDLDKEFTIVVNDKAITEKRTRKFDDVFDGMYVRFDTDFLFPVGFEVKVPKPEPKAVEAGGQQPKAVEAGGNR